MKLKLYILSTLFFLISCKNQTESDVISSRMKEHVKFLSSDSLMGREVGTKFEKLAADYIISQFKDYNLEPLGTNGFLQSFQATIKQNPHSNKKEKTITGVNVVGFKNNNVKETIIIGAHYDHIGFGDYGSLHVGEREVHNGADDNASGVSLLINLVDILSENNNYNYLFIAFSGEEYGLFGSSYYAKNPTIDLKSVRFMLNFDMVGRLNKDRKLAINGVGTSSYWTEIINESNDFDFNLILSESGSGASDHTSFYLQEIPVLHFFTGQHEDYHKPTDDFEKINFEGMNDISLFVTKIINNSKKVSLFDFQETKSNERETPKFSVTLGIMPDYLFNGKGLKIDGVTKGKTASKFNILKGDIVVKIGEVIIHDIYAYMDALSLYKSGDKTNIEILRNNEKLAFDIIFD